MKNKIKILLMTFIGCLLAGCTCYSTHVPGRRIDHPANPGGIDIFFCNLDYILFPPPPVVVAPPPVVVTQPAPVVVATPPPPPRPVIVTPPPPKPPRPVIVTPPPKPPRPVIVTPPPPKPHHTKPVPPPRKPITPPKPAHNPVINTSRPTTVSRPSNTANKTNPSAMHSTSPSNHPGGGFSSFGRPTGRNTTR